MRRKNTRRKPVCPNCQARIRRLYYIVHKSVSGNFSLECGHEDNLCPDQDGIEYYCPECNVELFHNEALAEAFLLGKIAQSVLLEKKLGKQVKGGKETRSQQGALAARCHEH